MVTRGTSKRRGLHVAVVNNLSDDKTTDNARFLPQLLATLEAFQKEGKRESTLSHVAAPLHGVLFHPESEKSEQQGVEVLRCCFVRDGRLRGAS